VPRRLDIDFGRHRSARGWTGWLLALAGAAACGLVAMEIDRVDAAAQSLEREARTLVRRTGPASAAPVATGDLPALARRISAANRVVERLDEPWLDLLAAVEATAHERVALLSFEPDAAKRTVRIGGEARDTQALGEYVEKVAGRAPLAGVHLSQHELRDERGITLVRFTLTASWASRP